MTNDNPTSNELQTLNVQGATSRNIILTGLVCLSVLGLTLALLYQISASNRHGFIDRANNDVTLISRLIANQTSKTLFGLRQLLQGLNDATETLLPKDKSYPSSIQQLLFRLKEANPYILDLLILDRTGKIIFWTGEGTPPAVRDRDYAAAHLSKGHQGFFVGSPHLSRTRDATWFFGSSIAIRDNDGLINSIIVATVSIAYFEAAFANLTRPNELTLGLVDDSGTIVFRLPTIPKDANARIEQMRILARQGLPETPFTIASSLDDRTRIVAATRIADTPLIAYASFTEESILAPWRTELRMHIVIATVATLFILFVTAWLIRGQMLMERTRHELARLAAVDPLTGLRNRRMFMELARREFDKAKRYDTPLACVMIDVDRFKDINDTHGHEAGDRALKAIATELARHARRTDILARLGGEEFILLLPETGLHGAFVSAEQHRQRIEELSIPLAPEPLEITISLGVTELDEADSSLDALMSRADHALYAAKAKGRNRTECLPPCTDAQPNADVPAD